ncbi:MAG: nitrogen fixation protein NifQ [Gammaproteobacteria bacterium]
MLSQAVSDDYARNIHARLIATSFGLKNDDPLACMLASQCAGISGMPPRLGLSVDSYIVMMQTHFAGAVLPINYMSDVAINVDRNDEQDELRNLFLAHREDPGPSAEWIADILVAGSMGGNHLWQDLGLWNRKDLSAMISANFPELARKNDKDMKWKKFFYKQLCIQEGIYTCRSPSCEVCPDYKDCFSPED